MNDPAARQWLTDLLIKRIGEYGLDVYRNDFNMDPLDFWRKNDAENRQGITEIRYIEGLYAMWDAIRASNPHLFIDNCSSGGRRIDLEMCMRSVPLWRSDTSCSPGHPDWNQVQTCGLGQFVPLFTAAGWTPQLYESRCAATGGAIVQWDYKDEKFSMDQAKKTLEEIKQNQKYWYGDLYSYFDGTLNPYSWAVYQFHRPDLNAGVIYAFRRDNSLYTEISLSINAINVNQKYAVTFIDEEYTPVVKNMTGQELSTDLKIHLSRKGSSMVVQYKPL